MPKIPPKIIDAARGFFNLAVDLVLILGLVFAIRTFVVSPFQVDGASMLPGLTHRDFLWIDRMSYRFHEPERGDVVVFHPPVGDGFYVKRIVGLPGETVEFRDGEVWIREPGADAQKLPEFYLDPIEAAGQSFTTTREKDFFVPEGHVFVMGDNRRHSSDSRAWQKLLPDSDGALPEAAIVGRVFVRIPLGIPLFGRVGLPTGFDLVPRVAFGSGFDAGED